MDQDIEQNSETENSTSFHVETVDVCHGGPLQLAVYDVEAHLRNNARDRQLQSCGDATGGRLSNAALCGIWYLQRIGKLLRNSVVVELGCGTAACGLFAARTAAAVLLTDADDNMLQLARQSLRLNVSSCRATPRIAALAWGATHERAIAELCAQLPNGHTLVIGADLVYYRTGVFDLLHTIASLLRRLVLQQQQAAEAWAVLPFTPRLSEWQQHLHDAAAREQLQLAYIDTDGLVPADQFATGRFGTVRQALLWLEGRDLPPGAGAGQHLKMSEQLLAEAVQQEVAFELPAYSSDSDSET